MAFHPYPQVIPSVFNRSGFGPPQSLTSASACPWVAHPASRLQRATARHLKGSLSLRLASSLTSPRTVTRWLILQKARRHGLTPAPTACRHTVSGAVSLPSRGAFHLSLTVLVHYRSQESTQPWRVVPPDSHRVPRVRRYLGSRIRAPAGFAYGAFTLFRGAFQRASAPRGVCDPAPGSSAPGHAVPQPPRSNARRLHACVGLGWSAFARRYLRSLG